MSLKLYNSLSEGSIITKPTILNWTLTLWLIPFCLTGSYILSLGGEVYFLKGTIDHLRIDVFYLVVYTVLLIPMGYYLHKMIVRFLKLNYRKKLLFDDYLNINLLRVLILTSFFAGLYTLYMSNSIPLFDVIKGDKSNLMLGRSSIKFDFQGINFIKNVIFNKTALIVSFMLFSNYLHTNKFKILTFFAIFLAIFSEIYTLEKAPLAFYLLALFLIKKIHEKSLSKKSFFKLGLLLFVFLILMYLIVKGQGFSFFSIFNRIIFVPLTGLYYTLIIFPDNHDFLMGASFPNWITSFYNVESERSARVVMEYLNPKGIEMGTSGVVNSLFIAEAYANFGKFGLYFSPILVGFIISILDTITSSQIYNRINPGLIIFFIIYSPVLGGFVDFIWNVSWFFIFLILHLIKIRIKI
ncbi:oligosaccharide repeat unit polymerase [Flavobacteriales bacterium]|nr:oligosaccharide repeat unit polymerase [Flavobacteriales bacterium]